MEIRYQSHSVLCLKLWSFEINVKYKISRPILIQINDQVITVMRIGRLCGSGDTN